MASPISRRPGGLLDLLLTQQQGENPRQLLDAVAPTIEMWPFYQTDRLKILGNTTVLTAVGNIGTRTVPSGEIWKLIGVGYFATFATAAQRLGISAELVNLPDTLFGIHDFGTVTAAAIGDIYYKSFWVPEPLLLPSGASIRGRCTSLDLDGEANIQVTQQLLFVRMEA